MVKIIMIPLEYELPYYPQDEVKCKVSTIMNYINSLDTD